MANPQLSVELTARIAPLTQGLQQAANQVTSFYNTTNASLTGVDRSFARLNNTRFTFGANFQRQAALIQPATRGLTVGANQAGNALTNLGRIAQDAPFGFIGIQNNLNPLLESFQRLRAETGSNAAAFRALAQSFIGPAGIGVALSLVTSAITLYFQAQQRSKSEAKAAKEVNEDYSKSLDAVSRGLLKGTQEASASIIPLKALYDATQNASLSLKERKKAVDELQKQYPDYFGSLRDEAILAGNASTAYNRLTQSILAKAKASALEDELKENAKQLRLLEKRQELNAKALASTKEQDQVRQAGANMDKEELDRLRQKNSLASSIKQTLSEQNKEAVNISKEDGNETISLKQTNQLQTEKLALQRELNTAKKVESNLTGALTDIVLKNGVDVLTTNDKSTASIKTLSDVLEELRIELLQNEAQFGKTFGEKRIDDIGSYQKAIDELIKLGYKPASSAVKDLANQQQRLVQLQSIVSPSSTDSSGNKGIAPVLKTPGVVGVSDEERNRILENNKLIESSFTSLASSIGTSLANGGSLVEAFGQGIFAIIGDILTQFGKMTLAAGIASSALGKALRNPLNPLSGTAAIAAGAALIAVGAAVKTFSGSIGSGGGASNGGKSNGKTSIPAFANGVTNFRGGMALVGERGAELVNLPTGSDVIPNNRSMRMLKGSSNPNVVINAGIGLSGREFVLWFKEQEALVNRTR